LDLTTPVLIIGGSTVAIAFYLAWSIGANDLANSMGTSVGSKALTIRRAVIIAGIFEFLGAALVGVHVTRTLRYGIVDPHAAVFVADPYIYLYGMIAALLAAAIWVTISTYYSLPISTTQSIVGALIGFGVVAAGVSSISWGMMIEIGESWILSPLIGAALAFFIFFIIKKVIFDSEKPLESTKKVVPFFSFTLMVVILFSIFKSIEHTDLPPVPVFIALFITLVVGIVAAVISYIFVNRYKPKEIKTEYEQYKSIEHIFIYLQLVTACYVAFAHGANDVANAIGPLVAILDILEFNAIVPGAGVPVWIILLGAIAIVIGLSTWGYKVIHTIGQKITEITPTRGFAAEFSTALVVLVCSRLGLPVSTSQVIVGAVIGVGFAKGIVAVDLKVIRTILASWILTVPISAVTTAGIFICIRAIVGW
jgi:PiT family inorganic phosphate transporter